MKLATITGYLLSASLSGWIGAVYADEAPLRLKMSGYIEAGASDDLLTSGYPDRHTEFVRGELRTSPDERWTAEVNEVTEFGGTGTLFVVGHETQIGENWVAQMGAATSASGDTLPRLRLDLALSRKWLDQRNLVTTVSITEVQAKDVHRDHAIQFATAYFFDLVGWPWAVEVGLRRNNSDPGSIAANTYYGALTSGREKERVISLRIGAGHEAYQLVGNNIALANFSSNSLLFTWREWLSKDGGIQFRADTYHSPYYEKRGFEASWFAEF